MSTDDAWVRVATVTRPHGVKGALRLHLENPQSDLFHKGLTVRVLQKDKPQSMQVQRVFARGEKIEFEEVTSREAADALRGAIVEVKRDDFPALEDDETYLVDLIGAELRLQSGERVGMVTGLSDNGAQPLLQAQTTAAFGDHFVEVPFVESIIVDIDDETGHIIIDPPAGLIDGDDEERERNA